MTTRRRTGVGGSAPSAPVSIDQGPEAATATWAAAITVRAQHVLDARAEVNWSLAEAAESARDDGICRAVVAVIGVAVALGHFAVARRRRPLDTLLVDLDPWAGGIGLLVGGETARTCMAKPGATGGRQAAHEKRTKTRCA